MNPLRLSGYRQLLAGTISTDIGVNLLYNYGT